MKTAIYQLLTSISVGEEARCTNTWTLLSGIALLGHWFRTSAACTRDCCWLTIRTVVILNCRTAIEAMSLRHKDKKGLTWNVMNVSTLSYPDQQFDAVVDKGTMDSILCGENSTRNASRYCSEVARVLKPGGCFFIVSYGVPENRCVGACRCGVIVLMSGDFDQWSCRSHSFT